MAILFFGTSFLFINSHLSADLDRVQDRIQDYQRIIASIELPTRLPIKVHGDASGKQIFRCSISLFEVPLMGQNLKQP